MKGIFNIPIIIAGFVTVLLSCTVKEERQPCPCRLEMTLDVRSGQDSIPPTMRFIFWAGDVQSRIQGRYVDTPDSCLAENWPAYRDSLGRGLVNALRHKQTGICMMPVTKSVVDVCSITGLDTDVLDGKNIIIPKGQDADPLWMCSHFNIDCTGEEAKDFVKLHKQYCAIRMKLYYDEGASLATYPVIKTNVYGLNMMDPERILVGNFGPRDEAEPNGPYDTAFEYSLKGRVSTEKENGYDVYYLCLPRLEGNSADIRLEMYTGDDTFWAFRDLARTINRNNLVDWTARDLGDLEITMDITRTGWSVQVVSWEHEDLGVIRL